MEHGYYLGIDIDDQNAIVSVYQAGMREPETVSTIAGGEVFQIPVILLKKRGIGQWFVGDEAKRVGILQGDEPIDYLLSKALNQEHIFIEEEKYSAVDLFALYLKKMMIFASRLGNPNLPDKLVVSVESLSREMTELFAQIGEKLQLEPSQITLIDRKEAFYYFSLNQKKELWLHDVCLFDYRGENIRCCYLTRNMNTVPQMITIEEQHRSMQKVNEDESFLRILQDMFRGKVVSSVYLVGDGFDGEWMKTSLSFMCKGRHAFIGKNLYSKGACFAAAILEKQMEWPYIYIGDNEMKVNISLKVRNRGTMEFLTLISAGENWYEAEGACEVILDGTPEITFWLQLPHSRDAKIEKLTLSDLPERENKTTRLRIKVKPLSDTKVSIIIRDLGFGEIVKSSEKTWEYVMSL